MLHKVNVKIVNYSVIFIYRIHFLARKFGKFMGGGKFVGANADIIEE